MKNKLTKGDIITIMQGNKSINAIVTRVLKNNHVSILVDGYKHKIVINVEDLPL